LSAGIYVEMQYLQGRVRPKGSGFGVAGKYLAHVEHLICERTGLPSLIPGTLNVGLEYQFIVLPDATISAKEYNDHEVIKLQRCVVRGVRAVIMRPHTHELSPPGGHGPKHLELLSHRHLRDYLRLSDNETLAIEVGGDLSW
jgi:CTP-dependent riboflavin kinase